MRLFPGPAEERACDLAKFQNKGQEPHPNRNGETEEGDHGGDRPAEVGAHVGPEFAKFGHHFLEPPVHGLESPVDVALEVVEPPVDIVEPPADVTSEVIEPLMDVVDPLGELFTHVVTIRQLFGGVKPMGTLYGDQCAVEGSLAI